jgi:hypothetical protein
VIPILSTWKGSKDPVWPSGLMLRVAGQVLDIPYRMDLTGERV